MAQVVTDGAKEVLELVLHVIYVKVKVNKTTANFDSTVYDSREVADHP